MSPPSLALMLGPLGASTTTAGGVGWGGHQDCRCFGVAGFVGAVAPGRGTSVMDVAAAGGTGVTGPAITDA